MYERFGDSVGRTDALLEQLRKEEEKTAELVEAEQQVVRWRRRALVPAAFLLLSLFAAGLFFWREKSKPLVIEKLLLVQAGNSRMVCASEIEGLKEFGTVQATRVTYPLSPPRDKEGKTALGIYSLNADTCLIYAARDSVQGLDSIAVKFDFTSGKSATVAFKVLVEKPESEVAQPATLPGRDTLFKPKDIPYPHDITECAIQPPPAWQSFLAEHLWWLRWAFFVPFTAFLFALWRWLEFRRRKLIAQMERRDQPPYFWNIRIPGADEIVMGDSFAFALQVMRRRAASDVLRLDLSKTIEKTAEHGGMPDFRYRQLTRPVDYLLLIERGDPANHRAQLFDALYRAFKAQEIEIARFWYDGDLGLCFDEQNPRGVALPDLAHRFTDARLLVVSSGAQLLSPVTGKLAPWTDIFTNWKERALLTPKPTGAWGLDERRLATLFTLLPATLQGLGFWVDELDAGQDARFEDWQKHVKDAPHAIFQPDAGDPVTALMLQFDPQMLRWVAACAIYPSLHWDLTLWLGRRLMVEGRGHSEMPKKERNEGSEEALVTVENLLKLFRVSWFVNGEIPTEARAELLDWLERNDPTLLTRLRGELAEMLRQNPPPQNSAAYDDYALNIALNEWLATQDPDRKKELEAEIAQRLEAGAKPDFTVLKYLDRPRSALDFIVPDAWRKYVYPSGYPALGWKGRWKDLLWALPIWLAVGVGVFWPYEIKKAETCFWISEEVTENSRNFTLCLDSDKCKILYAEYKTRNAIRIHPISELDSSLTVIIIDTINGIKYQRIDFKSNSFIRETLLFSDNSIKIYVEARANLAAELYNRALNYAAMQKDSACILFQLAAQLDSLDNDYRRALAWCGDADKDSIPEIKGRFRLSEQPEAGRPFEFVLTESTPSAVYELDPGDGSRKAFSNNSLSHTYEQAGTYRVVLYARYAGQVVRLQTAPVVVANEIKSTTPVIDENTKKPVDTTAALSPPVVTIPTESGAIDTTNGLPPGRYILTCSYDKTVKLWDMEGRELTTFAAHEDGINTMAISPNGKLLATGGLDNKVKIWELLGGKILWTLEKHTYHIWEVSFSPDGKRLATGSGSSESIVIIWDVATGKDIMTLNESNKGVWGMSFSPDGRYLATGSPQVVRIWDLASGAIAKSFDVGSANIWHVAFSPDGQLLAAVGSSGAIKIWDLRSDQVIEDFGKDATTGIIWSVAFSPDGQFLVTGKNDGVATIWDIKKGQRLANTINTGSDIQSVAFSPDGKYILTSGENSMAQLWDLNGKLIHTYAGHEGKVYSAAFLWIK